MTPEERLPDLKIHLCEWGLCMSGSVGLIEIADLHRRIDELIERYDAWVESSAFPEVEALGDDYHSVRS